MVNQWHVEVSPFSVLLAAGWGTQRIEQHKLMKMPGERFALVNAAFGCFRARISIRSHGGERRAVDMARGLCKSKGV